MEDIENEGVREKKLSLSYAERDNKEKSLFIRYFSSPCKC